MKKELTKPLHLQPQEGLIVLSKTLKLRFRWSYGAIALYVSALPAGVPRMHPMVYANAMLYAGCYYDALRRSEPWDEERVADLLGASDQTQEIIAQMNRLVAAATALLPGSMPSKKNEVGSSTAESS